MRMQLIAHNGSVQYLNMPAEVKELYKTVWEIKQQHVLWGLVKNLEYPDLFICS